MSGHPHTDAVVALFGRTAALALLDGARRTAPGRFRSARAHHRRGGDRQEHSGPAGPEDAADDGFRIARGFAVDDPGAPAAVAMAADRARRPGGRRGVRERRARERTRERGPVPAVRGGLGRRSATAAAAGGLAHPPRGPALGGHRHRGDLASTLLWTLVSTRRAAHRHRPGDRRHAVRAAAADLSPNPAAVPVPLTGRWSTQDVQQWLSTRSDAGGGWSATWPRPGGTAPGESLLHQDGDRPANRAPESGADRHRSAGSWTGPGSARSCSRPCDACRTMPGAPSAPPPYWPNGCPRPARRRPAARRPTSQRRTWPRRSAPACCTSAAPAWPFATPSSGTRSSPNCPTTKGSAPTTASPGDGRDRRRIAGRAEPRRTGTGSTGREAAAAHAAIRRRRAAAIAARDLAHDRPSTSPG